MDVEEEATLTPQQARELTVCGATVVLLDFPAGSQLGIDLLSFTTANKFKGIKMVPPGPHLLHFAPASALSSSAAAAASVSEPGTAFSVLAAPSPASSSYLWLFAHSAQVITRRLAPASPPALSPSLLPLPPEDERRVALAVSRWELDTELGPYAQGRREGWQRLTSCIDEQVVNVLESERLRMERSYERGYSLHDKRPQGAGDEEKAVQDGELQTEGAGGGGQTTEERVEERRREEKERQGKRKARSALSEVYSSVYTAVPPLVIPADAAPAAVTALHLDRSHTVGELLEALAARYSRSASSSSAPFRLLLAELQHAFLSFLIAQDAAAFLHWKHLLTLLSLAFQLLTSQPQQLRLLLSVLHCQLQQLPSDLMRDPLSSDSFIANAVRGVMGMLQEVEEEGKGEEAVAVRAEGQRLRQLLHDRFDWDGLGKLRAGRRGGEEGEADGDDEYEGEQQDEDEDEYAPVVVRLPDGCEYTG